MNYKSAISQVLTEAEYHSSISKKAEVHIEKKHANSTTRYANYYLNDKQVGRRVFFENGKIEWEYGIKDSKHHGYYYYFHPNGKIQYRVMYQMGKPIGIASQWNDLGNLIGISIFKDGTGLELWVNEHLDKFQNRHTYLAEERNYVDGNRHGFERWWNGDDKQINMEGHFKNGIKHGIFREWNSKQLDFGFPEYYVNDYRVSHEEYIQQSAINNDLPTYKEIDNTPNRKLPKAYTAIQELITTMT